jgi:hypothetical protein
MAVKTKKKTKVKREPKKNDKKIAAKNTYVRHDNPALQELVEELRSFVKAVVPGTKVTVNSWSVPTFEKNDPFCLYMVGKNHVTFGFHYGTSLEDPEGLLEGSGKNLRHVKLRTLEDLQKKGLKELVLAAARLEGKPPMKGMGGKRA